MKWDCLVEYKIGIENPLAEWSPWDVLTVLNVHWTMTTFFFFQNKVKVVDPQKLDLRHKKIILLSRIAILLLKGYFGREKVNFHEKKFEIQTNNFINKLYFFPNFFSYRFLPNFKKLYDFYKLQIYFSIKRFPTT